MQVLISPKDEFEAKAAVNGGADIIDVKNPDEGSLGANFPWVIRQIRNLVPDSIEVSATIGDFPHLPGSASLAALGAAVSGADYVKVGLKGSKTRDEALFLMRHVTRAVKEYNINAKVVLAGYADYHRAKTLDPFLLPEVARRAGCHVVMVDTFIKDGTRLFYFMDEASCARFIEKGHDQDLEVALAGSIKMQDIPTLKRIGADIIGIRGAVCSRGDRLAGTIQAENVKAVMDIAKNSSMPTEKAR
ncbi:MAG: (5-formylfuran-3-yl)methyl phosphate synthase [Halobacteriota archaeon]